MGWEFGVSRCKVLCVEWINNKVLVYSTGNYIQYPEKEYVFLYIYKNHFAVQQKLTQHCKSTIFQENKFLKRGEIVTSVQ